jgi:hypothetical protein
MQLLYELVISGRIADVAIAVMLAEAALLTVRFTRQGRPGPGGMLANVAAGLFLLAALRAALSQTSPAVILVCLSGALAAHTADLAIRLRS